MRPEIIDGGEELDVATPRCFCGKIARLQTSWTEANPLRRFHVFCLGGVEFPPREKAMVTWQRVIVIESRRFFVAFKISKPTHSDLPL
ncbi:hypothetical protein Pyn_12887 [Prunus yedoensis var. nudiflora]|uniref:Uncharacterized protein n=1 Tax=Prunus yedoensis var. nudiflora TaxID=2094558 RepID=A0A314UA73_PRUYE|nr:hypothetical protein Pyn_12887 [Prunus yedoensis var. nudiflora]